MSEQLLSARGESLVRFGKAHGRYLWLVGVCFFVAAVWAIGWDEVRGAVARVDLRFIVGLMLVEAFALGLRALKWRIALGPGQNALRACFISKAGGNFTPGRVGEFSPLLLSSHRTARTGAWILLDRVLEASSTLFFGFIGLAMVLGLSRGGGLIVWIVVLFAGFAGGLFLLTRPRFIEYFRGFQSGNAVAVRVSTILFRVGEELRELGRPAPALTALSIVATMLDLVVGYLLYASFGFGVALTVLALAQLVHALATLFPLTPNATGVPYAAAAAVLNQVGGVPLEVAAAAVGVRMISGSAVFWSWFAYAVGGTSGRRVYRTRDGESVGMELERATILITGASQGLGQYLAVYLGQRCHHVIGVARSEEGLKRTAEKAKGAGVKFTWYVSDLSEIESLTDLANVLRMDFGGIDVVIHNAADVTSKPLGESTPEEIAHLVSTNVTGPLQLTRLMLPQLAISLYPTIVCMSSLAGFKPNPTQTAYSITKRAVNGMADALRAEFEPEGYSVLNVALSSVGTETQTLPGQVPVAACAQRIEDALLRGQRELFLSPASKWLMRLYAFLPGLASVTSRGASRPRGDYPV